MGDAKLVSNWVMGEVLRVLKEKKIKIDKLKMPASELASFLKAEKEGAISRNTAKSFFQEMVETGKSFQQIMGEKDLRQIEDSYFLREVIEQVIKENPEQLQKYLQGKNTLFEFFMG